MHKINLKQKLLCHLSYSEFHQLSSGPMYFWCKPLFMRKKCWQRVFFRIFTWEKLNFKQVAFVGVFHPEMKTYSKNKWVHEKAGQILNQIYVFTNSVKIFICASEKDWKVRWKTVGFFNVFQWNLKLSQIFRYFSNQYQIISISVLIIKYKNGPNTGVFSI